MEHSKFLTLKQAAGETGLPYHKLQRAAKRGLIPTYRIMDGRPLVRVSDIVATLEASKKGGDK